MFLGIRSYRPTTDFNRHMFTSEPWSLFGFALTTNAIGAYFAFRATPHAFYGNWLTVGAYVLASLINCVGLMLMLKDRYGTDNLGERLAESLLLAFALTFGIWATYEVHTVGLGGVPNLVGFSNALRLIVMTMFDVISIVFAWQIVISFTNQPRSYRLIVFGTLARTIGTAQILLFSETPDKYMLISQLSLLIYAGLFAFAALDPSMARHDEQWQMSLDRTMRWRYVFVGTSLIIGPLLTGVFIALIHTQLRAGTVLFGTAVLPMMIAGYILSLIRSGTTSEHQALHDDLTGLPNRPLLLTRLEAAFAALRKEDAIALLYIDLDRFKTVNDSLGHDAGNQLLQQASSRLINSVDHGDTVARLSGDEFVVLLLHPTGEESAMRVADKILDEFRNPFELSRRQKVFITPSIGIAFSDQEANTPEILLANADTALYQAKERGRNRCEIFDPDMHIRAQQRLTLESAMRGAIEHNQFVLHYQPKVDLVSGNIMGVEALIRWNHPEFGLLGPGEFISIAEDTGLIGPLGEWVIYEACRQAQHWVSIDFPAVAIAVNLSPRQFQVSPIADVVARALRTTELSPSLLELEITETLAFYGADDAIATLYELRDIGVSCTIDDFGTGYSSLSYLSRFPIDRLKIDKSFVNQITENNGEAPLVSAIIAMAHSLGLEVVAEGVERRDQVAFLQQHGCDQIQGNLFSRPLPPEEVETLIMLEHVAGGEGRLSLPRQNVPQTNRFGINLPQPPSPAKPVPQSSESQTDNSGEQPSGAGKYGV
jgi:diguanylate cyclase (GGDEF)-like protein